MLLHVRQTMCNNDKNTCTIIYVTVNYFFCLYQIAQLAASGADLNAKFDDTVNAQHAGITPLALACATNRVDVVSVSNMVYRVHCIN